MSKIAAPKQPQHRRRADSVTVNITFDREAFDILKQFCPPGQRGTGRFLGQLLYEHRARVEERKRLRLDD